jgi:hypothetical protein
VPLACARKGPSIAALILSYTCSQGTTRPLGAAGADGITP